MASLSELTNVPKKFIEFTEATVEGEKRNVPLVVNVIVVVIINCITCPMTILLNVLVIKAVKKRPRLQTNTNILLACLAITDALTGFLVQPTFIVWKILELLGETNTDIIYVLHLAIKIAVSFSSLLHLVLVTCERLMAIKYTMHYLHIATTQNIKRTVFGIWVFTICCVVLLLQNVTLKVGTVIMTLVLILCIVFIAASYLILYRETVRHQKMIKTQQLPQEEVERFAKESKALKTVVYIVGAVLLCFLPMTFIFLNFAATLNVVFLAPRPWINTFIMLNSLLNPLIYCWRQKEMRQFVFVFLRRALN
ncbi:melanocyte-stimulating hormone receptor-like [Oculina patagonica]